MFCQSCKTKIDAGEDYCRICGRSTLTVGGGQISGPQMQAIVLINKHLVQKSIQCTSCGYAGKGEFNRKMTTQIVAWLAIFFFPIFPIIYFTFTYRYRCPQCKSHDLKVKNDQGQFESQVEQKRKVKIKVLTIAAVFFMLVVLLVVKLVD